jgi:hypothetical protein
MVTTVTDNSPQAINTSLFSLDKQVQEIKTLTDTFNDKISGINPKANVISVNGKQFTICDPTYKNASAGRTMPGMDNSKAKIVIL